MIRRLDKGRYEVIVYLDTDPTTGKERRLSRSIRGTREQAKQLERKLKGKVDRGRHRDTETAPTVGELVEKVYAQFSGDWSPVHAAQVRRAMDRLIIPTLGKTRANKLTPRLLDRSYKAWLDERIASSTVRKAHLFLSRSCEQAMRWEMLDRNPTRYASPPRQKERNVAPPTPDQVGRLLDAAPPDLALFLRLAVLTGARRGELCALRWSALDDGGLTIRSAIYVSKGEVGEKLPKTNQVRRVDLDEHTLKLLHERRERAESLAFEFGCDLERDGFVFSDDPQGASPWRPDSGVSARFTRLRKSVGLDHVRLHDLRHASATWQFAAGVAPHTVSQRLGHASKAMTFDVYGHARKSDNQGAADTLAGLLDD